mmetsp:Transcript_102146/g.284437  ORF Transcript_102146/g.284437 Transcript_102146/m.284437 type:complete len:378 (-) Transcript_102146:1770-2903(-)
MDVAVGIIHVGAAPQFPEVVHRLRVFVRGLLRPQLVHVDGTYHLDRQAPEVRSRVFVAALDHSVVRELLDHQQREIGPLSLLVRIERIVKTVVESQPLCPRQVDLRRVLRMLLAELESLVPAVRLHMQGNQLPHIAQLDDGLLRKSVVLVLPKGFDGHLQELCVCRRQLPHHLDEAVQGRDLDEDLHGLTVLARREVHLAGRAQVSVLLRGGGLLQDQALCNGVILGEDVLMLFGVAACVGSGPGAGTSLLALLGPMFGLIPLPQLCVHLHSHVILLCSAVELGRLAVLALEGQHLRCDELLLLVSEACPVAILLRNPVEQVNVAHVPNADEGLAGDVEAQALQRIQRQQAPVGIGDAKARDLVGCLEVLLFNVSVQ